MLFVILPAYNEEENVGNILNDLYKLFKKKFDLLKTIIVVVDDGSTDNTLNVIKNFISTTDFDADFSVKIINHEHNKGLGEAIKSGFEYVLNTGNTQDVIVTLDCDSTHPVELIPIMVNKIKDGIELVVASRYVENSKVIGLSLTRRFLSFGARILFKLMFPIKNIKDYTSGFRAYKFETLKSAKEKIQPFFSEKDFSSTSDILIKLKRFNKNINAEELPLTLRYDLKVGKSKMKVWANVFKTLKLLIKRNFTNK